MQRALVAIMVLLVLAIGALAWQAHDTRQKLSETQKRLDATELRLKDEAKSTDLAMTQQDIEHLRSCVNGQVRAITQAQPLVDGQC